MVLNDDKNNVDGLQDENYTTYHGIRKENIKIKDNKIDVDRKTCNLLNTQTDSGNDSINKAKRIKCKCENKFNKKLNGIFDKDSIAYQNYKSSAIYKKSKDKFKDANAYIWYYLNNYTNNKDQLYSGKGNESENNYLLTDKNDKFSKLCKGTDYKNDSGFCKKKNEDNVYLFNDKEFKKFKPDIRNDLKNYNVIDKLNYLTSNILKNRLKITKKINDDENEGNKKLSPLFLVIKIVAIIFLIYAFISFFRNMYQFFDLNNKHFNFFYNYQKNKFNKPVIGIYILSLFLIFLIPIVLIFIEKSKIDNVSEDNTYAIIQEKNIKNYNLLNLTKEEFTLQKCPKPGLDDSKKEDDILTTKEKLLLLVTENVAVIVLMIILLIIFGLSFYLMNITHVKIYNKYNLNVIFYILAIASLFGCIGLIHYYLKSNKEKYKVSIKTNKNNNCQGINYNKDENNNDIDWAYRLIIGSGILFAVFMIVYIVIRLLFTNKLYSSGGNIAYLVVYLIVFILAIIFVYYILYLGINKPLTYLIVLVISRIVISLIFWVITYLFMYINTKVSDLKSITRNINIVSVLHAVLYSYPLELTSIFMINLFNKRQGNQKIEFKKYKIENYFGRKFKKNEINIKLNKSKVQHELLNNLSVPSGIPWNFPGFNFIKIICAWTYIVIYEINKLKKKETKKNYHMNFIPPIEQNKEYTLSYTSANSQVFNTPFNIFYFILHLFASFTQKKDSANKPLDDKKFKNVLKGYK